MYICVYSGEQINYFCLLAISVWQDWFWLFYPGCFFFFFLWSCYFDKSYLFDLCRTGYKVWMYAAIFDWSTHIIASESPRVRGHLARWSLLIQTLFLYIFYSSMWYIYFLQSILVINNMPSCYCSFGLTI